jgi:glycosyltransferase involved in cell wall biosynthesis
VSDPLEVYVEVTTTLAAGFTAGYERMARSVLNGLATREPREVEAIPVVFTGRGKYRHLTESEEELIRHHPPGGSNRRRADRFGPLSPMIRAAVGMPVVGRVRASLSKARRSLFISPTVPGLDVGLPPIASVWLDLEPAWNDPDPRDELLVRLRAEGVHTAVLVADIMPELFPEWFDTVQRALFGEWLRAHLEHSEQFLCISRNTEADLKALARSEGIDRELPTVVIPLGADLPEVEPKAVDLPPEVGRFLLVVGTLEPRKNQAMVLEAFDRLRRRHDDLGLVFVGRQGWMVDDLVERIRSHPEYDRRLLWPDAVDDGQLTWLYRRAFLMIAPSRYEGLGVPVMEALYNGCATITSTGGALEEAGDGRVETIDPDDLDGLVVAIERHLLDDGHHSALVERAAGYVPPSWSDTTEAIAAAMERFRTLPPPIVGPRGHDW